MAIRDMPYTPIIGTLGYIVSPDRTKTLLIHRTGRSDDVHLFKYNGLGGKMRPDEDVAACMRREIFEESGLICDQMVLRGTINWTGFGPAGESWLGFIFRIDRYHGVCRQSNDEGVLVWEEISRLGDLPMWDGDRYFLPFVFDDDAGIFHGHMPYKNGKPVSWQYERF